MTNSNKMCPQCGEAEVLKEADYIENLGTPQVMLKSGLCWIDCPHCGWSKWASTPPEIPYK